VGEQALEIGTSRDRDIALDWIAITVQDPQKEISQNKFGFLLQLPALVIIALLLKTARSTDSRCPDYPIFPITRSLDQPITDLPIERAFSARYNVFIL